MRTLRLLRALSSVAIAASSSCICSLRSAANVGRAHDLDAAPAQLVERRMDPLGADAAGCILDHPHRHAGQHGARVEGAELDAVIGGEPANIQLGDAMPPQLGVETGGALGVIVAECRIAVGLPVLALAL